MNPWSQFSKYVLAAQPLSKVINSIYMFWISGIGFPERFLQEAKEKLGKNKVGRARLYGSRLTSCVMMLISDPSPATAPRQASVAERLVALPPAIKGANASCHCYSNHHRRLALSAAPRLL